MKIQRNLHLLLSLIFISFLLSSCYTQKYVKQYQSSIRLYNLDQGERIEVNISGFENHHGKMYGYLKNNIPIDGEYIIHPISAPLIYKDGIMPIYKTFDEFLSENNNKKDSLETMSNQVETIYKTFPELYGFGRGSNASPVGSGILVGENGIVIEIVFYKINLVEKNGDGIAKDNMGNYYRVFLSTEII